MDHEAITQRAPALVLATLYTDIDEYEGLGQKPRAHHPVGELGLAVARKVHWAGVIRSLVGLRGPRGDRLLEVREQRREFGHERTQALNDDMDLRQHLLF